MKFIPSFSFLIFLGLYNCGTSSIRTAKDEIKTTSTIQLHNLISLKLSEKLAGMGTLNDEISFIVLSQNNDQKLNTLFHTPIVKIEKEGENIPLDFTFNILDQEFNAFYFILVEMDTDREIDEVILLIIKALNTLQPRTGLKDQLTKALKDDDILGIVKITPHNTSFFNQNELKFWGLQLFDEYDYRLIYSVK